MLLCFAAKHIFGGFTFVLLQSGLVRPHRLISWGQSNSSPFGAS